MFGYGERLETADNAAHVHEQVLSVQVAMSVGTKPIVSLLRAPGGTRVAGRSRRAIGAPASRISAVFSTNERSSKSMTV
jgi:hypothetical protein